MTHRNEPQLDKPDGICKNCKCDLWNETGPGSSQWGWTCLPSWFVRKSRNLNPGEAWNTGCGLDKWESYSEWARDEITTSMAKHVPMDPLSLLVMISNGDSRDDINITPARKRQLELLNEGV